MPVVVPYVYLPVQVYGQANPNNVREPGEDVEESSVIWQSGRILKR
jgi:molybdopterin biosynthesis enzyme